MTAPDPGSVLQRALMGWGLGHLVLGRHRLGWGLLVAELVAAVVVAWLTIGLVDSSAYLVPFLAGVAFIVTWAWQAIHAYRTAHRLAPARAPTPERSPAAAIGWLSLPILLWGAGFWLLPSGSTSPSAVLDRFVTAWGDDGLGPAWPAGVVRAADTAASSLGTGSDRFRDVRVRLTSADETSVAAVAEAIHFERRESRFLWVFAGSELVPVADERVLTLRLAARPASLPVIGEIGAVRWELVEADAG